MKYWVYMNGEVPGSYTPGDLSGLTGFSVATLVCPSEGEILEKNWRRSGEFADIAQALNERDLKLPPPTALAQQPLLSGDINQFIDTTSARLFSHVADLMKELENRREERALTVSLQRQIADIREQLRIEQDKSTKLESQIPRIGELEEALRKDQGRMQDLNTALKAREEGLCELRLQMEKVRTELEGSRRRLSEALNDLAIRNRLVDKLSRDLSEKEVSLAKSLGVIRHLEEDLNRISPIISPAPSPPQETLKTEPPSRNPERNLAQETAAPEQDVENLDQPAAQGAMVNRFKKFISKYNH